jgi:O-succinylbenzoate synthase
LRSSVAFRSADTGLNIAISRYELAPGRHHGGAGATPRAGALIRFEFEPGLFGYADCHPWPELGDIPLNVQLELLRTGGSTVLLDRSLVMARVDAEARSRGEWLFQNLEIPESHASFPYALGLDQNRIIADTRLDNLRAMGFNVLKFKVGQTPLIEIAELLRIFPSLHSRRFHVRFDFNERLSLADVTGFLNTLMSEIGEDLSWIDWIEDPCPFNAPDWDQLRAEFGLPLALDRAALRLELDHDLPIDILVLKPAVMNPEHIFALARALDVPVAVTSYLDHPLGQVSAAWVAARALQDRVPLVSGGLATHLVYEPNRFSEELFVENAHLLAPLGTGFGFDECLEDTEWQAISS